MDRGTKMDLEVEGGIKEWRFQEGFDEGFGED